MFKEAPQPAEQDNENNNSVGDINERDESPQRTSKKVVQEYHISGEEEYGKYKKVADFLDGIYEDKMEDYDEYDEEGDMSEYDGQISLPETPELINNDNHIFISADDTLFEVDIAIPEDVEGIMFYRYDEYNSLIGSGYLEINHPFTNPLIVPHIAGTNANYVLKSINGAGHESENGVNIEVEIETPSISGLNIECGEWGCLSGGETYPITFDVTDATNCSTSVELVSGLGTTGSVSNVTIDENSGYLEYTTGSSAYDVVRITVEATGPSGNYSDFIDITLE
ncbi:hypothetical protein KJ742_03580 [Patescibacteria group bacterium]|nr:hypothetical protein [Patescibacteria group bacterium]MBU1935345.1 hypothetical protein [Patescibacteria group bacterium]